MGAVQGYQVVNNISRYVSCEGTPSVSSPGGIRVGDMWPRYSVQAPSMSHLQCGKGCSSVPDFCCEWRSCKIKCNRQRSASQDDEVLARLRSNRDKLSQRVITCSDLSKGTTKTWAQIKKSDGDEGLVKVMQTMLTIRDDLEAVERDAAFLIDVKEKRDKTQAAKTSDAVDTS
jgi:hypothetical protein